LLIPDVELDPEDLPEPSPSVPASPAVSASPSAAPGSVSTETSG